MYVCINCEQGEKQEKKEETTDIMKILQHSHMCQFIQEVIIAI